MPRMTLLEKIQYWVNFLKQAQQHTDEIARLTQAIAALQAQFKYLQQRIDSMEVPR